MTRDRFAPPTCSSAGDADTVNGMAGVVTAWHIDRRGRRWPLVLFMAVLTLSGTACSVVVGTRGDEPHAVAARVIERDAREQFGLEVQGARCEAAAAARAGDTFECRATVRDREIPFVAEMVEDDAVVVQPDRLIIPEDTVHELESVLGTVVTDQHGADIPSENVDCGRPPVVADRHNEVGCALRDSVDDVVYEATVKFDERGELVDVEVGEAT